MATMIRHLTPLPLLILALAALPRVVAAHCDALDGPVVTDARVALEGGDVNPVLKWVDVADETEVRDAFEQTLLVRSQSPEAEALADRFFFETVVRLHRAFEGAPYTGLKPAGSQADPSVDAADAAMESGSLEDVKAFVLGDVERGLEERFHHVMTALEHVDDNVEAGREFVHAYVEFIHYVERLHKNANSDAAHSADHAHAPGH